jgi:hypothetical protein
MSTSSATACSAQSQGLILAPYTRRYMYRSPLGGEEDSLLYLLGQFVILLYQLVSAMYQRILIHLSRIRNIMLYQLSYQGCISKIILIHLSLSRYAPDTCISRQRRSPRSS